jgi:DGQHR domain-containing protein
MSQLTFSAVRARQSSTHTVLSLAASASEVLRFALIDRVARDQAHALNGFQRPQIAGHIREIQDYLEKSDAILPNPIVVAFIEGGPVTVTGREADPVVEVTIDLAGGPKGLVVDGQQRLTALAKLTDKDFQLFVSIVVCKDEAELRRQFVLINNTRPLPKSLVYELLPSVDGLPQRLEERSVAANVTARLNFDEASSLRGLIHMHTNPGGVIRDTAIQKVIMQSAADGAMRKLIKAGEGPEGCFQLASAFYQAVAETFPKDWKGMTPHTSRLIHGAGIMALGGVMDELAGADGARTVDDFKIGLDSLKGRTAWTSGEWDFRAGDKRHWKF